MKYEMRFKNHHTLHEIFAQVDVVNFIVQGRAPEAGIISDFIKLPPNSEHPFTLPTMHDLSSGDAYGHLRVRVKFGKSAKRLSLFKEWKISPNAVIHHGDNKDDLRYTWYFEPEQSE